jgi:hypothetical protein
MLLLFSVLSLKWVITDSNYRQFLSNTSIIPGFVLMYHEHCGHCKEIHPAWLATMAQYENDTSVIVGEISCGDYRETCRTMYDFQGYPCFAVFLKGRGNRVTPFRSVAGFSAEAESTKRSNLTLPCLVYPDEYQPTFPSFVYQSTTTNPNEICQQLREISSEVPSAWIRSYFQSGPTTSYRVIVNDSIQIPLKRSLDIPSLTSFTKEWLRLPFGDWPLPDGITKARRFAFMIIERDVMLLSFRDIVTKYLGDFVIGKMFLGDFKKVYPNITIKPQSLVAANPKGTRFKAFDNVTDSAKFASILDDVRSGARDPEMDLDLSLIFPVSPDKNENDEQSERTQSEPADDLALPQLIQTDMFPGGIAAADEKYYALKTRGRGTSLWGHVLLSLCVLGVVAAALVYFLRPRIDKKE